MFSFSNVYGCFGDIFDDFLGSLDTSIDASGNDTAADKKHTNNDKRDKSAHNASSTFRYFTQGFYFFIFFFFIFFTRVFLGTNSCCLGAGRLRARISRAPSGTAASSSAITIASTFASVASFTFIPRVALAGAADSCLLGLGFLSEGVEVVQVFFETFLAGSRSSFFDVAPSSLTASSKNKELALVFLDFGGAISPVLYFFAHLGVLGPALDSRFDFVSLDGLQSKCVEVILTSSEAFLAGSRFSCFNGAPSSVFTSSKSKEGALLALDEGSALSDVLESFDIGSVLGFAIMSAFDQVSICLRLGTGRFRTRISGAPTSTAASSSTITLTMIISLASVASFTFIVRVALVGTAWGLSANAHY